MEAAEKGDGSRSPRSNEVKNARHSGMQSDTLGLIIKVIIGGQSFENGRELVAHGTSLAKFSWDYAGPVENSRLRSRQYCLPGVSTRSAPVWSRGQAESADPEPRWRVPRYLKQDLCSYPYCRRLSSLVLPS